MIYPLSLYNFGKVCKDSSLVGDVLRALCKQKVDLSPEAQIIYDMITNDNEWMEERIADQKARWAQRQRDKRTRDKAISRDVTQCHGDIGDSHNVTQCHGDIGDSHNVTQCHGDIGDSHNVTIPSLLPSSLPTTPISKDIVVVLNGGGEGKEIDERLIYPEEDMQKFYARQMGVPENFIPHFNNRIKELGFQYINRSGATVKINRNNWKSVLRKFYEQEQRKEQEKTQPVKNALEQDGYKAEMEMA